MKTTFTIPQLPIPIADTPIVINPVGAILQNVPVVLPVHAKALAQANGFKNVKVITSAEVADINDYTGQPVFMPLQFEPVTYIATNGGQVSLSGMYIPLVIVSFKKRKLLTVTVPAGAKTAGPVIELCNPGSWEVKIKGSFLTNDGTFPHDALKLFNEYMAATESLPVTHELFSDLGIDQIAIQDVNIEPKQGFENMLFFEITALEDPALQMPLNQD